MKATFKNQQKCGVQDLEKKISKRNKDMIAKFLESKEGYVTEGRRGSINRSLVKFATLLEKDFDKATKDEVTKAWGIILKNSSSDKSTQDLATNIRMAYKYWLGDDEEYPKVVSKVKRPKSRNILRIEASDMLSEKDIYKMIKACRNWRDKFFIALLGLDGALRPIEALNIMWGDVKKDTYGHFIVVRTAKKSGDKETRNIRIINSAPYFEKWCNEYPTEKNDNSLLFINYANLRPFSKNNVNCIFRRLRTKLGFRKCYPYLLRHSLITRMSKDPRISVPILKKFVGHSLRSNVISEYQHLGDEDIRDMQLEINGLTVSEKKAEERKSPITCPHCKKSNEFDSEFCGFCNFALSQARMISGAEKITLVNESIGDLSYDEDFKRLLVENIEAKIMKELRKKLEIAV